MVENFVNYKDSWKKRIVTPIDFADVDACVAYANDENLRKTCERIVANRTALRAAYEAMVRTGQVQESLRSGKDITFLGSTPGNK